MRAALGAREIGVNLSRSSADVRPEYRLSSYGPSLDLVRQVCALGRWDEGLAYFQAWEKIWDDPRLREWSAAIDERRLQKRRTCLTWDGESSRARAAWRRMVRSSQRSSSDSGASTLSNALPYERAQDAASI